MISGRQTLASIDEAVAHERAKINELEGQIRTTNDRVVANQHLDTEDFKALAKLRVDQLAEDDLVKHIDEAEQQVLYLLRARDQSAINAKQELDQAEVNCSSLEAQRNLQAERVDAAAERVDEAEARTQQRLDAEPEYQAQREKAKEAERMAMHASEKAERSEAEQQDKGESYRDDKLFTYLWERNYGMPEYHANSLVRWLDTKVAHMIGYTDAKANYQRLTEIPVRLREHAERLQLDAEAEYQTLKDMDTKAQQQDGIPDLQAVLEHEQAELDDIDKRIEAAQQERQALLERESKYASGEDEHTQKAVEYLASEFARDDLSNLQREVTLTPYPDDDIILNKMYEREKLRSQLEASMQGLKHTISEHRKRMVELEDVRNDFKRQRFDRTGSSFSDGAVIAMMLGNFLNGMLDRRSLWRVLQEQQRYKPQHSDPTFGSGGFGRGTVWSGGLGDIGGMGDILRRRGGLGGGLGGGIFGGGRGSGGGGGFRTGGGF